MALSKKLAVALLSSLLMSACSHSAELRSASASVEDPEVFTRVQTRPNGQLRRYIVEEESFDGRCSRIDREVYRYDRDGALVRVRKELLSCGLPIVRSDHDCRSGSCMLERSVDLDVDGTPEFVFKRRGVATPQALPVDARAARNGLY